MVRIKEKMNKNLRIMFTCPAFQQTKNRAVQVELTFFSTRRHLAEISASISNTISRISGLRFLVNNHDTDSCPMSAKYCASFPPCGFTNPEGREHFGGRIHDIRPRKRAVMHREVFALVGESGCGKSTTGASILRLIEPTGGRVYFKGQDIAALSREEMRLKRRDMQFVFQNPYSSLNPRMNVRTLLSEPVRVHYHLSEKEIGDKVAEMMEMVGLSPDQLNRYPHQFSGGQKQRISIARALISRPSFVVADEPVSALDVSIQAQVLNVLMQLQQDMELSMIFISHDLNVVRHISNSVGVIDQDYSGDNDIIKFPYVNMRQETVTIKKGERIGQGMFMKIEKPEFLEVESMENADRGGFGSTGKL